MKEILAYINTGLQENNLKKVMELLVQLAMKIHQEHSETIMKKSTTILFSCVGRRNLEP